jgi:hypothetical protein
VELGVAGARFEAAVGALITADRSAELHAVLDDSGSDAVAAIWRQLESAEHVRRVLTTDPIDVAALDRLAPRLPVETVTSLLLDALSESESRTTRMSLFLRLRSIGIPATPPVLERLRDPRWYVQRNMLLLLNEIGAWPQSFSALPYVRHSHPMVRREALALAVRITAEREAAICAALGDEDERAIRIGVSAAREHGLPAAAVPAALDLLRDAELSADLVTALLRMMARHDSPDVVQLLQSYALVGARLLGRPRLAPRSPAMLAAVASLAALSPSDARSRTALDLARASADADVRAAATKPESREPV